MSATWVLVRHEMAEAIRSRWLIAYAAVFAVLSLALSLVGLSAAGAVGLEGYGRTTASLINLCLTLVPLVAILLGSAGVAGERESGALELFLSQPLTRTEWLLGRVAGSGLAIALATLIGFGVSGLLIGLGTGAAGGAQYAAFLGIALLLAAAYLAIGTAISAASATRARATAVAVVVWFASVVFFDLVLIGAGSVAGLGARGLAAAMLLNPVEVARMLALLLLDPSLEVLGPVGGYLVSQFGPTGAAAVLLGTLAVWIAAPLAAAVALFGSRDAV